jgi:hypothetical protein
MSNLINGFLYQSNGGSFDLKLDKLFGQKIPIMCDYLKLIIGE